MNIENIYNIETNRDKYLEFWNSPPIISTGNCYSYVLQYPWTLVNLGHFTNPGFSKLYNMNFEKKVVTIDDFIKGCQSDGLTLLPKESVFQKLPNDHYLVVAAFHYKKRFLRQPRVINYHFSRNHPGTNLFSDKNGCGGKVQFFEVSNERVGCPQTISGKKVNGMLYFSAPNKGLDISVAQMLSNLTDKALTDPNFIKHKDLITSWKNFHKDVDTYSESNLENLSSLWDSLYKNIFIPIRKHTTDEYRYDLIQLIKNYHITK